MVKRAMKKRVTDKSVDSKRKTSTPRHIASSQHANRVHVRRVMHEHNPLGIETQRMKPAWKIPSLFK
jgi:hypothetical protein